MSKEGLIIVLLTVMICINGAIWWKLYQVDTKIQYYSDVARDAKTMIVGGTVEKVALVKNKVMDFYSRFKQKKLVSPKADDDEKEI